MSPSCHSPPNRTSIAKGTNARPLLSTAAVAWVARTRRSRGAGRAREKRRSSFSARGLTSPLSTRAFTQATSDGSSAEACDGTSDRANVEQTSKSRDFTAAPFDRAVSRQRETTGQELGDSGAPEDG